MIPNRGYQHIISPGLFFKLGPLTIQLKPEHHFSENKILMVFGRVIILKFGLKRYHLWNHVDIPERFGERRHNSFNIGQSSIKLNWKKLTLEFQKKICGGARHLEIA